MDLTFAVSLAGATVLAGILVEVVKRAASWTSETTQRVAPLLSVTFGIIAVVLLTLADGRTGAQDLAVAIITGILAGAASSGLYDAGTSQLTKAGPTA